MVDEAARLIIVTGVNQGQQLLLDKPLMLFGRGTENEVILNDKMASRVHAKLSAAEGIHVLRDNDSRNGTFVNGKRIQTVELGHGDQIRIGGTEFRYENPMLDTGGFLAGKEELSFTPGRKAKSWHWKPSRSFLVTLVLVALILAIPFVWQQFIREPRTTRYPFQIPHRFALGFIPDVDKDHADKVVYIFTPSRRELDLVFKVWDIDDREELDLFLNGEKIHDVVPTGSGNWSGERRIRLPDNLMILDETNELIFDNPRNPPGRDMWGVSDVDVVSARVFPCDPEMAHMAFEIGKAKFEAKKVVLQNLYESIQKFELALNYLKACDNHPEFYLELTGLMRTASADLEEEIKNRFFHATKYYRLRNFPKAELELRTILAMIPDTNNEYHLRAKRELARLTQLKKQRRSG